MLLTPNDVLDRGLSLMGINSKRKSDSLRQYEFHRHYGSSALDLAEIWLHLTTDSNLPAKEKSEKGFKMYMAAVFFLWVYPKNASTLGSRFGICERNARGEPLWRWVKRIASLKERKIVWDERLDSPNSETFIVSIDGTDFRIWEKKHHQMNIDRGLCSQKFNHAALKYEIALSVFDSKCVWINGPFRGGEHDLNIYRSGLKDKIADGKRGIVDRGYRSSKGGEESQLSYPNPMDSGKLNNFKSRARLRQESFNGRLKFFASLSNTFRHGAEKHKHCFEAIVVMVQYQMDNGSPIFAV